MLEYFKEFRGLPEMNQVDNGPECISYKLDCSCRGNQVKLVFIQPGKPLQNAYFERWKGSIRRKLLNSCFSRTLREVRQNAEERMAAYAIGSTRH